MSGTYSLPKAFWDVDNKGEPGRFVFLNDFLGFFSKNAQK